MNKKLLIKLLEDSLVEDMGDIEVNYQALLKENIITEKQDEEGILPDDYYDRYAIEFAIQALKQLEDKH